MKFNSDVISDADLENFEELARQFSVKTLGRMFPGESADGNLQMLPEVIATAFSTGIATSWMEDAAGHEFGVWGKATDAAGTMSSAIILATIAETCGGVAMLINAQGVASNLLMQAKNPLMIAGQRAALCLQESPYPILFAAIDHPVSSAPVPIQTVAVKDASGYRISGMKSFVHAMPETDIYVVMARIAEEWGCFVVPSTSSGISVEDAGRRTGLRACNLSHIRFDNVAVSDSGRIDESDARSLVIRASGLMWIGMAAIAAGIAKGAHAVASRYIAERYQGGRIIENHPAIKLLISGAEIKIRMLADIIRGINCSIDADDFLKGAAALKLSAVQLASEAVTDCLQVFGGYGYMEDFGMEKRLRDISVLKSASGPPFFLKQFVCDIGGGGGGYQP